jgi:NADH/F420H2 dehydrogenase subunit C
MNSKILLNHIKLIKNSLPIEKIYKHKNEIVIYVNPKFLIQILLFLKNSSLYQYNTLVSITAVDYPKKKFRFEMVYELLSIRYNSRIKLKTCINELSSIESCEQLFLTANWFECEVFDMYGVFFLNHTNLKRILTDYGFEGHPLRKDFPLSGYVEVRYDEKNKRVVNEYIELSQEYRVFDFQTPWNTLK